MADLKWDDLRAFLAVARHGTLAGAAEVLAVNASTIHRRIGALEAALDARLFERTQRGYGLTHVGEALVPQAEEAEAAVSGFRRIASGHDRTAQGPVVLTLPETLLTVIAPRLADAQAKCPGLRPIVRADDRLLDLGVDADLALRPGNAPPPSAVGRKVGQIKWAVYAQSPTDAAPWVLYSAGCGPSRAVEWQARHAEGPVLAEVSSVGAMHRMLSHATGRGLLPCYLGDPTLTRVGPIIETLTSDLWLLIHADLRRSARVRALIDLLVPRIEEARPQLIGEVR